MLPHPESEASEYTILDGARFLGQMGIPLSEQILFSKIQAHQQRPCLHQPGNSNEKLN